MFAIFRLIHEYAYHNARQIAEIMTQSIATVIILSTYILLDIFFRRFSIKKKIRIALNVSLTAAISSMIKVNLLFFADRHPKTIFHHYSEGESAYTIWLHSFLSYFVEMSFYLTIIYVVQKLIKRLILTSYSPIASGFISKIPKYERDNIHMIKSKENYIEVYHGEKNKHKLINYRFSNAINELGDELGMQIHRSYWVAKKHLKTLQRYPVKNKYYIQSINNERIPVSRTHIQMAKQAKEDF